MDGEFSRDDLLLQFEAQLRNDVSDARVDYERIEKQIIEKANAAGQMWPLAVLKTEEILPDPLSQNMEDAVFKNIHDHVEYIEPIEECIKTEAQLPDLFWRYFQKNLEQKVDAASDIPPVDLVLKNEEIVSEGRWELMEDRIDGKILHAAKPDSCELALRADIVPAMSTFERVEEALDREVRRVSMLPGWEQVLKQELAPSMSLWEKIEPALFSRIDNCETARRQNLQSFGTFWNIIRSSYKGVGIAALFLFVSASLWGGRIVYQEYYRPLPCKLYQVQGPNIDVIKSMASPSGLVRSEAGGSMTIVNKKGYIELQNGSQLEIVKATEKKVHYKAHFANIENQIIGQGSITFFVNKQKKNETVSVSTDEYGIEVVGTYFKLQPDVKGHVSLSVKEGQVKVTFSNGDVRILKGGQNMGYDLNYNAYYSSNDGTAVSRQDIDQLPDMNDLGTFQQLCVTTNVPNAGVRIDGRYVGLSPIIILQPLGVHGISIEKKGFMPHDTSVVLGAGKAGKPNICAFVLTQAPVPSLGIIVKQPVLQHKRNTVVIPHNQFSSPQADDSGNADFLKAEQKSVSDWRAALNLYQKVFDNYYAPRLRKEAAYFSIAKLLADHEPDKTKAKEGFFNYLTAYPSGNFVGESWLRLAELEFQQNQGKAIEYYLRYFEKYPRHYRISELQNRVGLIYLQQKKYNEAMNMFKLALANLRPDNAVEKDKIYANFYKALNEKEGVQNNRKPE